MSSIRAHKPPDGSSGPEPLRGHQEEQEDTKRGRRLLGARARTVEAATVAPSIGRRAARLGRQGRTLDMRSSRHDAEEEATSSPLLAASNESFQKPAEEASERTSRQDNYDREDQADQETRHKTHSRAKHLIKTVTDSSWQFKKRDDDDEQATREAAASELCQQQQEGRLAVSERQIISNSKCIVGGRSLPTSDKFHERRRRRQRLEGGTRIPRASATQTGGAGENDEQKQDDHEASRPVRGPQLVKASSLVVDSRSSNKCPSSGDSFGWRERSSSITSDYCSNSSPSQNSTPILNQKTRPVQDLRCLARGLDRIHEPDSSAESASESSSTSLSIGQVQASEALRTEQLDRQKTTTTRQSTTIYENPLFSSLEPPNSSASLQLTKGPTNRKTMAQVELGAANKQLNSHSQNNQNRHAPSNDSERSVYTRQGDHHQRQHQQQGQARTSRKGQPGSVASGEHLDELQWERQTVLAQEPASGQEGNSNNVNKLEHAARERIRSQQRNQNQTDLYADSNHYLESALPFIATAQQNHQQQHQLTNSHLNGRSLASNGLIIGNGRPISLTGAGHYDNNQNDNLSNINNKTADNYNYIKPLVYSHNQQQPLIERSVQNSFELAQMKAAGQRVGPTNQQEPTPPRGFHDDDSLAPDVSFANDQSSPDPDQHLYCAVTATTTTATTTTTSSSLSSGTNTFRPYAQQQVQQKPTGAATTLAPHRSQANFNLVQQHDHHHHQTLYCLDPPGHQTNQMHGQQPYSIYKSPTSLTLNHSYQTLVEKLNENRHPAQFQYLNHHNNYSQPQAFYSNTQASTQANNNHPLLSNGLPVQVPNGNGANCANSSPVFSSLNTTSATATPPRGSNRQPFLSTHRNHHHQYQAHHHQHHHHQTPSSLAAANFAQKCLAKRPDFHCGHSSRLKCVPLFCQRTSWLVQLLVLLLLSVLLLLLGLFIVPPWTTTRANNQQQVANQAIEQQLAPVQVTGGAIPNGPNDFLLSRFQMGSPPLSIDTGSGGGVPFGLPNLLGGQTYQQTPPSGGDSDGSPILSGSLMPIGRLPTTGGPIFQQENVIKQQQQQTSSDPAKWPASMTNVVGPTQTPSNGGLGQSAPRASHEEASTQSYWTSSKLSSSATSSNDQRENLINFCRAFSSSGSSATAECSGNGKCNPSNGMCSCLLGFSGPTCALANCPNECSGRGECKLRKDWPLNSLDEHQLDSIAFQSAGSAQWRLSTCASEPIGLNQSQSSQLQRPLRLPGGHQWQQQRQQNPVNDRPTNDHQALYDQRLQWHCECQPGFTGSDCSLERELNCQDQVDNDQDGLADCEDDDCCSQPVCRDNIMCYKPPEPSRVLSELQTRSGELLGDIGMSHQTKTKWRFFAQWQFLIEPNSVQSYAQKRAFDRSRVAVIRGRVLALDSKTSSSGIVSVRVSVMENAAFGFTLTRQDGHFDLLVNGDEWLTLQFHRNAYTPIKRRIFVRQQAINALDDHVLMGLSARDDHGDEQAATAAAAIDKQRSVAQPSRPSFGLGLVFDLSQLVDRLKHTSNQRDEQSRAQLLECLLEAAQRSTGGAPNGPTMSQLDPMVLLAHQAPHLLHSFALVSGSSVAFSTSLQSDPTNNNNNNSTSQLEILYNSASFPSSASIAKPTVSLQLLPDDFAAWQQQQQQQQHGFKLEAVSLQLDIEGQTRRERLEPINGLSYQFAWNRRNVYEQKVYGFSELRLRVDYEFRMDAAASLQEQDLTKQSLAYCLTGAGQMVDQSGDQLMPSLLTLIDQHQRRKTLTFGGRLFMEAHQLNQHADIGRWSLATSARYDAERELVYFGSGWMLPFKWAYPPVVSRARRIEADSKQHFSRVPGRQPPAKSRAQQQQPAPQTTTGRLLAKGPNSSLFVALMDGAGSVGESARLSRLVQLDASGRKRLLDVPLSILTSKFQQAAGLMPNTDQQKQQQQQPNQPTGPLDDLELVYSNFESSLYISSRIAAKIVRISLASLNVLNKTLSSSSSTAALDADEEIDVEPLCGFGRLLLTTTVNLQQATPHGDPNNKGATNSARVRQCKSVRLVGPHSMALDEQGQLLYFVDGHNSLLALNLNTNSVSSLMLDHHHYDNNNNNNKQATPNGEVNRQSSTENNNDDCLGPGSRLAAPSSSQFLLRHRVHSLVWNGIDSSLYLITDNNAIVALRPDSSLEIIALAIGASGAGQPQSGGSHWPPFCSLSSTSDQTNYNNNHNHQSQHQLGTIRQILLDDGSNGQELLVLHQWRHSDGGKGKESVKGADTKRPGRFYLAKISLGIKCGAGDNDPKARLKASLKRVFDLHSAKSTWDPMIVALAKSAYRQHQKQHSDRSQSSSDGGASLASDSIDWLKLSGRPLVTAGKTPESRGDDDNDKGEDDEVDDNDQEFQNERVPFIHLLSGGFERADSLQINSDGTIFLLNLIDQSLRTISAYSPEQFNQVERNDLTLDRLFATTTTTMVKNKEGSSAWDSQKQGQQQVALSLATVTSAGSNQQPPFSLITLRNPIRPNELFEFHSTSGLLLSLTTEQLTQQPTTRLEFSYRILANNVNRYQQHEQQAPIDGQTVGVARKQQPVLRPLDEDDENDLEIQKLIFDYMSQFNSNRTSQLMAATNGYVRLGNMVDLKHNNEFELIRQYSNSRFVLQSIQLNQRPICTLNTDSLGVLTTFIQRPSTRTSWVELVYDPRTYLLRNVITKTGTTTATSQPMAFYQPPTSVMQLQAFPYDDKLIRSTKRIIYDEIFNHYCDLFIVDA